MDVSAAAEDRWARTIQERSTFDEEYVHACTPSYYNAEGKADDTAAFRTVFGGGPFEYIDLLREWRKSGLESDLELERKGSGSDTSISLDGSAGERTADPSAGGTA
jgi:hypothetical protein